MSLNQLPYELITQVISNLSGQDVLSFLQCNSCWYERENLDSFWHDLCKLNGIYYRHPDITWKQLYCSNTLSKMCPHISDSMMNSSILEHKKKLLWNSIQKAGNQYAVGNHILCLHPSCDFFGEPTFNKGHQNNSDGNKHNIILKLSIFHTLELWCNSCTKTIGFNDFALEVNSGLKSERYVMKEITHALATIVATNKPIDRNNDQLVSCIIQGRREIESRIYKLQYRHAAMHIVDKSWHTSWIDFLSGNSNVMPGILTNEKLLRSNGSLDPKLSLGKDFELVGSLSRWYIERVYGVSSTIISLNDLQHNPEYCKLAHTIRIRQQMSQVANFPSAFMSA